MSRSWFIHGYCYWLSERVLSSKFLLVCGIKFLSVLEPWKSTWDWLLLIWRSNSVFMPWLLDIFSNCGDIAGWLGFLGICRCVVSFVMLGIVTKLNKTWIELRGGCSSHFKNLKCPCYCDHVGFWQRIGCSVLLIVNLNHWTLGSSWKLVVIRIILVVFSRL